MNFQQQFSLSNRKHRKLGIKLELEQNIIGNAIEMLLKDVRGVRFSKNKERSQHCQSATDWGTPAGKKQKADEQARDLKIEVLRKKVMFKIDDSFL